MGEITQAIYNTLVGDSPLTALLDTYQGAPAIFTTDPAPGDAPDRKIVSAGEVAQEPFDTKTTRGWVVTRDVRCYTAATGSAEQVEAISARVRTLFHRQAIVISGFVWIMAECTGPIVADEQDAYGRIVTVRMTLEEL